MTPYDYLDYAEKALNKPSVDNHINCVMHLKRAAECEIDTLLHVLNMPPKIKRKNFPGKLEIMGTFGFVSPQSVARLNDIRNAVEHRYSTPKIEDLSLYFDLINLFVHALEGSLAMIVKSGGMPVGE